MIVVTAPSGGGKTTLCRRLLAEREDVRYSISCTTRAPRGQEKDGEAYHFVDAATFAAHVAAGDFLEHANVHDSDYGTLREPVVSSLEAGVSVLMDIDVQGAARIREHVAAAGEGDPIKRAFVDIFVSPPSLDALRARLTARGEDAPETIETRMQNARGEMAGVGDFAHVIVNDDLDTAYRTLVEVLEKEGNCA